MGFIKEPYGIDLQVYPSRWTNEDFAYISMVIAHYKKTGKMLKIEPKKRVKKQKNASKMLLDAPVQEMPNS